MRVFIMIVGFALGLPSLGSAQVHSQMLNWQDPVPQIRWMGKDNAEASNLMIEIRKASHDSDFVQCLSLIPEAKTKYPTLKSWIVLQEMSCFVEKNGNTLEEVKGILGHVEQERKNVGPWTEELDRLYFSFLVKSLTSSESRVKGYILEKMTNDSGLLSQLKPSQKADFYLALAKSLDDKKDDKALFYYEQSQHAESRPETEKEIVKLRKKLSLSPREESKKSIDADSDEARKLFQAAKTTTKHHSAALKAIEYVKAFPGSSKKSEALGIILDRYRKISDERDQKSVLNAMASVQYADALKWADYFSGAYDYNTAAELQERVLKNAGEVLYEENQWILYGKRRHWAGDYAQAIGAFAEVRKKGQGSSYYFEATYAQALAELRQNDFKKAHGLFSDILSHKTSEAEPYRMSSLYWAFRSHEKMKGKPEERESLKKELKEVYPFTYYSLLLQAESQDQTLLWPVPNDKVEAKSELYLLPHQKLAWERTQLLLKLGWFDESFQEIQHLPEPINSEQRVILAKYLAAAMAYPPAIRLLNSAWDEEPKWRVKETVRLAYPSEFETEIAKASEEQGLSPLLTKSLIRQESGFFVAALSRSNAIGLMQLIPSTAREVLSWMGLLKKTRVPEDVFQPELNVRLGTRYLSHVIRQFDGYVPLALAGYNAGPTRMKKWLRVRSVTQTLSEKKDWEPLDDLWLDELPWGEPRFYVKAILRNALIYQLLEEKELKIQTPVWKGFFSKPPK